MPTKPAEKPMSPPSDTPKKPESLEEALLLIEAQAETIRAMEAQLKDAMGGAAGWLVTCPNARYEGKTLDVWFRGGRAFIPEGPGAEAKAKELHNDFGYTVTQVKDWRALPQAESMRARFAEVAMGE